MQASLSLTKHFIGNELHEAVYPFKGEKVCIFVKQYQSDNLVVLLLACSSIRVE